MKMRGVNREAGQIAAHHGKMDQCRSRQISSCIEPPLGFHSLISQQVPEPWTQNVSNRAYALAWFGDGLDMRRAPSRTAQVR